MNILMKNKRLSTKEFSVLIKLTDTLHISDDIEHMSKFGQVIHELNRKIRPYEFSPINFIEFIIGKFGADKNLIQGISNKKFRFKMQKGVAFYETELMKHGNPKLACALTVNRLFKQTIPKDSNMVKQLIIDNLVYRRLIDIDDIVATSDDPIIKKRYERFGYMLLQPPQTKKFETDEIELDIPYVNQIEMDSYITPEFVNDMITTINRSDVDWISIFGLCLEASIFDTNLNIFETSSTSSFKLFNEIASNNTLYKLDLYRMSSIE
jgi:hypothetical protein